MKIDIAELSRQVNKKQRELRDYNEAMRHWRESICKHTREITDLGYAYCPRCGHKFDGLL